RPNATASVPAPVAPRSSQSAQQPRLQVSRSAVDATAAQAAPGRPVPPAPSERELTRAVEVETAVLQRRVAELSLMVERMQQDLRDAQAARTAAEQAARVASEKAAAATSPWVVWSICEEGHWPLLVG